MSNTRPKQRPIYGLNSSTGKANQHDADVLAKAVILAIAAWLYYLFRRSHMSMTMTESAILSSRFQITIPKAIRTSRNWESGRTFAFIPRGTGVLLVPVPEREDLQGLARGTTPEGYRDRSDRIR